MSRLQFSPNLILVFRAWKQACSEEPGMQKARQWSGNNRLHRDLVKSATLWSGWWWAQVDSLPQARLMFMRLLANGSFLFFFSFFFAAFNNLQEEVLAQLAVLTYQSYEKRDSSIDNLTPVTTQQLITERFPKSTGHPGLLSAGGWRHYLLVDLTGQRSWLS